MKLYLVMKQLTEVETSDGMISYTVNGCDGFMPLFRYKKDAKKAACKGKYSIREVETQEE